VDTASLYMFLLQLSVVDLYIYYYNLKSIYYILLYITPILRVLNIWRFLCILYLCSH